MLTPEKTREIIRSVGCDRSHIVEILLKLQAAGGKNYVCAESAARVAEELHMSPAQVQEILHFYAMLETKPRGRYVLGICNSAPCAYSRSEEVARWLQEDLGIAMGETTPDGLFSLQYIPCVGACDIGPVVKVGDEVFGSLTRETLAALLARLRDTARREEAQA